MSESFVWWQDGVIYQIYPRSFADTNHDGIGDLNGIVERLDYIADLGVDAIWLSPIYPSPNADYGYDVSNYLDIDPAYGSLEDFDRLVEEAHKRNLRVVLDLVLNHTSDQHAWFLDSKSSKDSPYRDWYLWRDGRSAGRPPNNWQSVFGGKGWKFDPHTGQYYFHMFYPEQPDLNWRNPKVRAAALDVFRFWLERGVDGFRLDVFNVYFKHAAFLDNPLQWGIRGFDQQRHIYDTDQPEMFPLLEEIHEILDEYPDRFSVGEPFIWEAEKAARYCAPGRLHTVFNFEVSGCRWNPQRFVNAVQRWEGVLHPASWPAYVLNNHDLPRSATRFGQGEDDERLKVAAALLLTLRGTPTLYYGEEIGMRDIHIKYQDIKDRVGRRFWPFYKGRDGCRSPMQWEGGSNGGFSTANPWLPVHPNYLERNVESQRADPGSLFNFYRQLLRLRRSLPALRRGMFQPLTFDSRKIMAFLRQTPDETVMVALNFNDAPANLILGSNMRKANWEFELSNCRSSVPDLRSSVLQLLGNEALILRQSS